MTDVGEGGYIPAAGHRVALDLQDLAVQPGPLVPIGPAAAQVFHPLAHLGTHVAGSHDQPAFDVEADQLGNGLTQVNETFGILQQLQVASVPADQAQVAIDHRNALGHVVQRRLQQLPVELHGLRGLVQQFEHILVAQAAMTQCGGQHGAGGGRADRAGQQPFAELYRRRGRQGGRLRLCDAQVGRQRGARVPDAEEAPDGFFEFAQCDQSATALGATGPLLLDVLVRQGQRYEHDGDGIEQQ